MKITAEVREYAAGMTDNEKKALSVEVASGSLTSKREGAGSPNGEAGGTTAEQIEKGMAAMSEKYAELGSELYLSEDGTKREAID